MKEDNLILFSAILFIGLFIFGVIKFAEANHLDLSIDLMPDYCIEDGDCEEGRILIDNGKTIIITKEYCLENNYDWYEESKMCKIR